MVCDLMDVQCRWLGNRRDHSCLNSSGADVLIAVQFALDGPALRPRCKSGRFMGLVELLKLVLPQNFLEVCCFGVTVLGLLAAYDAACG